MAKEICISSTPHETRLAIIEDEQLTEVYYERENEYTLAGSIYKGRVTRVLPGMQSAFVDVGLERDAFLYVTDFLEEQEESADFERLSGNGRREEQQGREPEEPGETRVAQTVDGAAPAAQGRRGPEQEFEEGTRRWRGRRGRRRGFRPQASPEASADTGHDASAPEPGAVRADIPENRPQSRTQSRSRDRFDDRAGDRPEEQEQTGWVVAPRSLPGETISKYGGGSAPAAAAAPAPASGGARQERFLPLSKPSTLIETPLEWDGGSLLPGESISRYRSAPPEVRAEAQAPAPAVVRLETEQQPETEASIAPPESAVSEQPSQEGAAGYEPESASASYRLDPLAPSEFRIAGPLSITAEDGEDAAEKAEQVNAPQQDHPSPGIRDLGNAAASAAVDLPQAATEWESSPSVLAPGGEWEEFTQDSQEDPADQSPNGLPVVSEVEAGTIEEEEESAEEEEYDFTSFYVHAEDQGLEEQDLEYMEEETLDQEVAAGAEVEEMVRDSHLDQRLAGANAGLAVEEEGEEEEFAPEISEEPDGRPESAPTAAEEPARRGRDDGGRGRGGRQDNRRRGNGRRQSAQTSSLPIISELLKQGQEILVQIAKEPIAKKGARITSHIALPGRFLVFMPTVNNVGVSRKISSDEDRQRLKRILVSERGATGGGFIVRTAAAGASEEELRADLRFLISLWSEIKQRSDGAKAPSLIYHDLNLVERILRDQVSDNFSTIWVDHEAEYERIVRFLNRFQPSLVRRVKLYTKETPLFEQFGIQEEITKALKSKVWLKSGGSIVINQTEALVAIDINTGKYVGKTARLEDTILKTNLDAIPEIVRQIRLRDLGGIIVIDFIDMDERKNRNRVMQALEEALKSDRAPSKVLQFNDFGLVAITRKRVKQSLERTLSVQCSICAGTGMVKSPTTVCNEIYLEMRKMQRHLERPDVLLRVNPEVVKTLKSNNARWLSEMEEMTGKTILVKSDPALHPEQFDIH